jgi:hypothetical protein
MSQARSQPARDFVYQVMTSDAVIERSIHFHLHHLHNQQRASADTMSDSNQLPSKAPADDKAAAALTDALQRLGPLRRNSSISRSQPGSKVPSPQLPGGSSNALSITSSLAGSPTSGGVLPPSGGPGLGAFTTPGMGMTMTEVPVTAIPTPHPPGTDDEEEMTAEEARAK